MALAALAAARLPNVPAGGITFASNQVRIRLPREPKAAWAVTQAVVARLVAQTTAAAS